MDLCIVTGQLLNIYRNVYKAEISLLKINSSIIAENFDENREFTIL